MYSWLSRHSRRSRPAARALPGLFDAFFEPETTGPAVPGHIAFLKIYQQRIVSSRKTLAGPNPPARPLVCYMYLIYMIIIDYICLAAVAGPWIKAGASGPLRILVNIVMPTGRVLPDGRFMSLIRYDKDTLTLIKKGMILPIYTHGEQESS
ncbi:MAG: hypothetical protein OEU74_00040 [Gammaproteobacteria bacterium]|nr:hypothetical protein [Gammaproteobacteria bacterium]